MKTMEIIFDDVDYCDELLGDIGYWCETHGIPEDKVAVDYIEDNVDGVDYYIITVNESLFSYLMYREFGITEKYGHGGWNGLIESDYHGETA
tara:strand:+ start:448 stop:723 length:276 start_codon:yes stop_codon:yes gene_type:complete